VRCALSQAALVVASALLSHGVSKKSSYLPWNNGETKPVVRFKTKLTFLALSGDGTRSTPRQAHGDQCGRELPDAEALSSKTTGHPKT